ncbi:hypothetical protein COT20_02415 [bacterium (Candidatus Gribaldobacteria) CG08_land_8_20_14_0_20_39_15]|uniref:Type V CRISPR-associated protein Cpf1 n=1 Tax=bacterium (Candidatus Gribaldobacteria) CG08_land_8_20_14_0_20_39_15 TaxID=2014273 RepID=A0A2M6XU94_9BACT|nr:MAG: hypothetical protein COT20_02415 [bacterium (Candidatus Gribaldobacteria) CG08_land_8_20_14_0_20_39_15]
MPQEKSIFDKFTNLYEVLKTLRFELKPVGKTLHNMQNDFEYDENIQTFLKDQRIEDAYQTLKPMVDKFHEEFITDSLQSETAKRINFVEYVGVRREIIGHQKNLKKIQKQKRDEGKDDDIAKELKKKIDSASKLIETLEKKYRTDIGEAFTKTGNYWKEKKYKNYDWKIRSKVAQGEKILSSQDVLNLIGDTEKDEKIQNALKEFQGFFTYISGFNQNRKNYYEIKKEASTAVATRVVHENLPKFSDNTVIFEARKGEYLGAYNTLKKLGRELVNRDKEPLLPITEDIFKESYFTNCLTQDEIEQYNKRIGNANFLINLYNQAKRGENNFNKLTLFKTFYKQIGCGKKKPLFFTLTHERKTEAESAREKNPAKKVFSVEEMLAVTKSAGETYLKNNSKNGQIETVPDFLKYINVRENFEGVYWSKMALNTVSNLYFADWSTLKEKLKAAKIFVKPDKRSEGDVKIPPVIELEALFSVLDKVEDEVWRNEGVFFKNSITEKVKDESKNQKNQKRQAIISQAKSPSRALLNLILDDIQEYSQDFVNNATDVEKITQVYFSAQGKEQGEKRQRWVETIKAWIDNACNANAMLKYFLVKENKIKGNPLDSEIANGLKNILFESKVKIDAPSGGEETVNWFKWRDALRNFLTKKPQDDAKENKLKLNFENPSLASGWDVNKEKDSYCVIFQNNEKRLFLAVSSSKYKNAFELKLTEGRGKNKTEKNNPLFKVGDGEICLKMEYNFWADVSKMIPKCSTQLTAVEKHFRRDDTDFIFPIGYKVTSGEKFTQECRITKEIFDLNNKIYKKSDITGSEMRYSLTDSQEKHYVKAFQKEFWELLLKKKNLGKEFSNKELLIEWKKFCKKSPSELSEWEIKYKAPLTAWINFCKYFLARYPKTSLFEYTFKNSEEYNSLDEFYRDVDICSYKLKLEKKTNRLVLDQLVDKGQIYLFEIRNQDSNDGKWKNHKNNIHTFYWETVFKDILNRPKLSGRAKIFYRKALPTKDLKKKKVKSKDGKEKEVIENYRFSKEKFILHVPIVLNFCLNENKINDVVNDHFPENNELYFLGIDRGEKHLAYYSLVDKNGKLIKQKTLNLAFIDKDGKPRAVEAEKRTIGEGGKEKVDVVECWDYNQLLEARAGDRDYARKNWQTIGSIKNLKEGYISQVVRTIADLATKDGKPTYIVLENLNTGFKRSRQKIEKSVYQKFELALAKKLNFLIDKQTKIGKLGSVTKALQLTPPVNTYGDIEKKNQAGIMLYTRPNYTSQTDPATGWRKSIYLKKGSEEYIKDQILGNKTKKINPAFSEIAFDGKDYCFSYQDKNTDKTWKLYCGNNGVGLTRFRNERNLKGKWVAELQDVVAILNGVFEKLNTNKSLLEQMKAGVELTKLQDEKYAKYTAWESLRYAIDLIQQIRNRGTTERDSDFILSPVRDENGNHFDSREYWDREQAGQECNMPTSGDANGAFNIARKGVVMNEHIKRGFDLYITDEEWDVWLSGEKAWSQWIKENLNKRKK